MTTLHYLLNSNGEPYPEPDLTKWAVGFEGLSRIVGQDNLGKYTAVSTVFLGLDHNFGGEGPPILWETMVFKNSDDPDAPDGTYSERCSGSREQAEAMHLKVLTLEINRMKIEDNERHK